MNRQDIIDMIAKVYGVAWTSEAQLKDLERFAALVASAEREEIAQMIEDAPALMGFAQNDQGGCLMCGFTPKLAAKAIRNDTPKAKK